MLIFSIYTPQNHQQHYPPNEQCVSFFFACFGIILAIVAKFKISIFLMNKLPRLFENFLNICDT